MTDITQETEQKEFGEPELKNPNTETHSLKRVVFNDGSYKPWNWTLPLQDEGLWRLGCETLGLTGNEMARFQNEVGDIVKYAIEYLQDDDPEKLRKIIKQELRHTPALGNRVYNLLHNFELLMKEKEDE